MANQFSNLQVSDGCNNRHMLSTTDQLAQNSHFIDPTNFKNVASVTLKFRDRHYED